MRVCLLLGGSNERFTGGLFGFLLLRVDAHGWIADYDTFRKYSGGWIT